MKVILLSDLRHLGQRGEVVEVKPGFARNFLLPQGLALEATPGNLKRFEQQRKKIDARHDARSATRRRRSARRSPSLSIDHPEAGRRDRHALRLGDRRRHRRGAGRPRASTVDRRRIDLEGGIKTLGDHAVRVDLHPEVIAEVTVAVVAEE